MSVIHGLCCHNEISAEDRVDPTDHLKVVLAMATMPLPSRRPNEAERVNGEEDCAECNQGNLEEFFARNVIHADLLFVREPGPLDWWSAGRLTRAINGNYAPEAL